MLQTFVKGPLKFANLESGIIMLPLLNLITGPILLTRGCQFPAIYRVGEEEEEKYKDEEETQVTLLLTQPTATILGTPTRHMNTPYNAALVHT